MKCKDCKTRRRHAGRGWIAGLRAVREGDRRRLWLCAWSAVVLCGPTAAAGSSAVEVRMWPTAVVTGDAVHLADIAQLPGGEAEPIATLRACRIMDAPPPGQSTVLTLANVNQALAAAGIKPTQVLLRGSSRCLVSRPGLSAARHEPTSQPVGPVADAARPKPTTQRVIDIEHPLENTLESAVWDFLSARLAPLGGKPNIRFSPAARRALMLSRPLYDFRIRHLKGDALGLISLEVEVLQDEKLVETVPIVAEVSLIKAVVLARREINRGEVIAPEHLMVAERTFARLGDIGVTDLQAAVGQEATRFIERGDMIKARDLRPRPLVRRGDRIKVWVRNGNLVIETVAKALEEGAYGDIIDAKNPVTGEEFSVTVTGPQAGEIVDQMPPNLATIAGK